VPAKWHSLFLLTYLHTITCSLEYYWRSSDGTVVHYKSDKTVNCCGFRCATRSSITVYATVLRKKQISLLSVHCQSRGRFQDPYVQNPLAHANFYRLFQTRLDYVSTCLLSICIYRHRSLPSVCWYLICYCLTLLFLASTVFAHSRDEIEIVKFVWKICTFKVKFAETY